MQIANSIPMWIAAGVSVSLVVAQAVLFAKKSYSTGKEIGLTEKQMKSAMKSSFITAIGPSLVILTGVLTLLVTMGAPIAWMRLSTIGSVMFESMAAGIGTSAMGVTFGSDPLTEVAFANALWTMTLGSLGWIIFATLTADKMPKVTAKFSGGEGNKGNMMIIASAAMIGVFGSLLSGHILAMDSHTLAVLSGGAIMLALSTLADKKDIQWLKEWALAFALIGGMVIVSVVPTFFT